MQYRTLGRTGVKISAIGLGSWLTYGNAVDDARSKALVYRAVELGVNFLDTADVYNTGEAERVLGDTIQTLPRHKLVLATKVFFSMSEDVNDRGLSRKHIMESVHRSLKNLKTDYIDLYQCHRYDTGVPVEETCRAMNDLIVQGKILYWGVSMWEPHQLIDAVRLCERFGLYKPVSNQPVYNLINRGIDAGGIEVCEQLGLGIVVYSPLGQGLLTGKYEKGKIPEGSRAASEEGLSFMKGRMTDEIFARIDALRPIAEKRGIKLSQLALAWCLRKSAVTSAIIGATKIEQLEENIGALQVRLDAAALEEIDAAFPTYPVNQWTGQRF